MWLWLVISVIAFVVLGPKEMPAAIRKLARYVGRFRRVSEEFKRQLMSMGVAETSDEHADNDEADRGGGGQVHPYDTVGVIRGTTGGDGPLRR